MPRALALCLVLLGLSPASAAPARADGSGGDHARERFAGALLLGHASGSSGESLWGSGFGLHLGYALRSGLYVGAEVIHHRGFLEEGNRHNVEFAALALVGYELHLPFIVLRPQLLGGVADVNTVRDRDGGFLSPYIAPSAFAALLLGPIMVGFDLRYTLVTHAVDNGDNSYTVDGAALYVHLGLRL